MVGTLAVFDFDGTITRGDTLVPLLVRVSLSRTLRHGSGAVLTAQRHAHRRDAAKEKLLAAVLEGFDEQRIRDIGTAFVKSRLDRLARPHVISRVRQHQAAGHYLILASASPQFIVEPAGQHLGFDRVLCTHVQRDDSGAWRLHGPNLRGEVKRRALERAGEELRPERTWAYGDSKDDLPMLHWVNHGVRVRGRRLVPVTGTNAALDTSGQMVR